MVCCKHQTLQLLIYFYLKGFRKMSCFYYLLFLRYLQFVNPTSQISNNFHTKLELLINLDREMISTWTFHNYLSLQEETTHVNIFTNEVTIQNVESKSKKLLLTHVVRLSIWLSWKIDIKQAKALSFYFQKLKTGLKNLVSAKSCGSLKIVKI